MVRADDEAGALAIGHGLAAARVPGIEVTMTVPGADRVIAALRRSHPHVAIGAGTVLTPDDAARCAEAGAAFLVSPTLRPGLVEAMRRTGATAVPGAFTPTEVDAAIQAGADAVKVFPVDLVGSAYAVTLRGPFPEVRLVASGGIRPEQVRGFVDARWESVCLGGALIDAAAARRRDVDALAAHARAVLAAVRASLA